MTTTTHTTETAHLTACSTCRLAWEDARIAKLTGRGVDFDDALKVVSALWVDLTGEDVD